MRLITILILLCFIVIEKITAQTSNPYKYETLVDYYKISTIVPHASSLELTLAASQRELQGHFKTRNDSGYHLVSVSHIDGQPIYIMVFERSSSYKEQELKKLVDELTEKINTSSKKYADSVIVVVQTNVLNYLKSIPNDVITKEYKENLTSMILREAEEKINALLDQVRRDIRGGSN